jgi:hypothetical protein
MELRNAQLAKALTKKTKFTLQEWDAFAIKDLCEAKNLSFIILYTIKFCIL